MIQLEGHHFVPLILGPVCPSGRAQAAQEVALPTNKTTTTTPSCEQDQTSVSNYHLQQILETEEQVQHHQVAICQGQIVGHSTDQQFSFSNKLLEVGGGNGGVGESTVKNKRD